MNRWETRKRPIRLEKRFEFETYNETRDFLDQLGEHSEQVKRFPDISFGRTYANITLRPENDDEGADLTDEDYKFAAEIDAILN